MPTELALLDDFGSLSSVERIVHSAAISAACPAAALYSLDGSAPICVSQFGSGMMLSTQAAAWLATEAPYSSAHGLLVIEDTQNEPALEDTQLLVGHPARFLVAIRVHDVVSLRMSVLLIADAIPRAGLSPAQHYVLATLGSQLLLTARSTDETMVVSPASAEQARAERLRLLESVVVNANDAILITEAEPIDRPGPRIVYCNAAFTRTTGYAEAEILGLTPRILQSPHIDRTSLDRLRQALEAWKPVEVELLNVRKDGTEFWVELSIVPVADERGWFTHWVSVQRDVSQRRVAEEAAVRARIVEVEKRALEAEIRERKLVEEQLLFAAYHDDLTRLRNRAYLMDRLATLIGLPSSGPKPAQDVTSAARFSLLFLDLDRFKLINDSLGHRAGDLLLMEVARRLRAVIRTSDTLARVGGDEFAILIESSEAAIDAVFVAGRVIETLGRSVSLGQNDAFIACSVGIAHGTWHYRLPEEILRDADIAMYAAKKEGGGKYAIYNTQMHTGAVERLALQTDLHHALARLEFVLDYQPIYNATSRKLIAVEALVRWEHPTRGRVNPDVFIPIAEEIGMIRGIDRWVMGEACRQLREWQLRYPAFDIRLSINVSGDELRDTGFIDELREVLLTLGIDGNRLQLEITESVFLNQPEFIGQVLAEVRSLGVRVALDDFGTGYSSLGYLDRYQIDTLKIDRTFVARMLRQTRAMAIMEGIVRMGSALQLDIVAEGVETEAQLVMLRSLGCSNVQGYLLGRPMAASSIIEILKEECKHTRSSTPTLVEQQHVPVTGL